MRNNILLIICILNFSCKEQKEIDYMIAQYEKIDFKGLCNIEIVNRERRYFNSIYLVSNKKTPILYVVDVNNITKKILIGKELFIKTNTREYYTDDYIKNAVSLFHKNKLEYLYIDSCNNIYISQISKEIPHLLKLADTTEIKDHIKINGLPFSHYKDMWYLYDFYK